MKYLGVLLSVGLYIGLFFLSLKNNYFLYNSKRLEINIILILLDITLFYKIVIPKFIKLRMVLLFSYTIFTVLILNCSLSFFVDLFDRINKNECNGDDMTWVIILPVVFIISIVWGVHFDKTIRKNMDSPSSSLWYQPMQVSQKDNTISYSNFKFWANNN